MFRIVRVLVLMLLPFAAWAGNTFTWESPYCVANCSASNCEPFLSVLGDNGYYLGTVIQVCEGLGNCALADQYAWSWQSGPDGTPTNLTGIGTDYTDTYVIPHVLMSDSGIYNETGYNYGTLGGAHETALFCLTVNPAPVVMMLAR